MVETVIVEKPTELPKTKRKRKSKPPRITLDQVRKAEPREVIVKDFDDNIIGTILARPVNMKIKREVKLKIREEYSHLDKEDQELMEAALLGQHMIVAPELSEEDLETGDLTLISMMVKSATESFSGKKIIVDLKK